MFGSPFWSLLKVKPVEGFFGNDDGEIFNHEGLLVTTIKVKLFDKTSEQLAPPLELELTIDPQKRVFEAFDRKDHLYVAIGGVK